MVSHSLKFLAVVLAGFTSLYGAASAPANGTVSDVAGVSDSTPGAPHFVIYDDDSTRKGPPPASQLKGFNVYALSVLLTSGARDKAQEWTQLSAAQRKTIKSQYAAAGIKLIVTAFGSNDKPTTSGHDAVSTANTMADWVIKYGVDGIDVDYEDFNAIEGKGAKGVAWLEAFTKQLRTKLPQERYILTHAPVAPWFEDGRYPGNAYIALDKSVGHLIDWYNVQFYNQDSAYTTCTEILTKSAGQYPKSSIFEIHASGVALDKLVLGKPGKGSAEGGFVSPATLATCLSEGKAKGWNAGAMFWEFPAVDASFIKTVRSKSWPIA